MQYEGDFFRSMLTPSRRSPAAAQPFRAFLLRSNSDTTSLGTRFLRLGSKVFPRAAGPLPPSALYLPEVEPMARVHAGRSINCRGRRFSRSWQSGTQSPQVVVLHDQSLPECRKTGCLWSSITMPVKCRRQEGKNRFRSGPSLRV